MAALQNPKNPILNAIPGAGYAPDGPRQMEDTEEDETMDISLEDEDELDEDEEEEPSIREETEEHYVNLAPLFDEEYLKKLSTKVVGAYEADNESRNQWILNAVKGLKILGVNLDNSDQALWSGSCTATHPLVLETAVKLQQKLSTELFPVQGPVKTQILGTKTEDKLSMANRVKAFMDYQITDEMEEFEDYIDKILLYKGIFGTCFSKTYFDNALNRPVMEMVRADLFVVNQRAQSLERADRFTQMDPISVRTMKERMASGFYTKMDIVDNDALDQKGVDTADALKPYPVDLGEFDEEFERVIGITEGLSEDGFLVLDHYCYYDFEKDPLRDPLKRPLPYIISVDEGSGKILSIRRDWSPGEVKATRNKTFQVWSFIPFMGLYSLGLIHLLGNFNIVLTAIMRSLTDAGQLYNLQGGYKDKAARIADNSNGYTMGEYKDVEGISGNKLGDAFLPHQFKEPSQVLFAMMQFLNDRGGQFANATDQVVADNPGYGNVGSTTALLDVAEKLYTGIFKRDRKTLTNIYKSIALLNYEYLGDDPYPFPMPNGEEAEIIGKDFDPSVLKVEPSADPNVPSQAKRASYDQMKLQALTAAKQSDPNLTVNYKPVIRSFFMNLDPQMDIKEVFPDEKEATPMGPLEDINAVISGVPIKAFPGQNHQAHIMLKNAWLSDPNQGKSEIMQPFVPLVQANIREHMLMGYQEQIGALQTGVASDPKTTEMVQAQIAQELTRMSQVTAKMDTPEATVAQAVKMEAEAKLQKNEMDMKKILMDFLVDMANIKVKSNETDVKAAQAGVDTDTGVIETVIANSAKIAVEKLRGETARATKRTSE